MRGLRHRELEPLALESSYNQKMVALGLKPRYSGSRLLP